MSVLSTIKGKIVNVQQDISESFRSLSKVNVQTKTLDVEECSIDGNSASLRLLSRYQKIWMQLHQTSEDLSQRAQFVDGLVANLFQQIDEKNAGLKQFTSELSGLVQLISDVDAAKSKIVGLHGAFKELESQLTDFEDVLDESNQMKLREKHEVEFEKHRLSKKNELEQVKASLASKHAEKLQKHENQLRATLQERQKVFEEAFREQMMKYITTGQVDYIPSSPISDLAEIEIEEDREELDRFLGPNEDDIFSNDKEAFNIGSASDSDFEQDAITVLKDEDSSKDGNCQCSLDGDTPDFKNLSPLTINESCEEKT